MSPHVFVPVTYMGNWMALNTVVLLALTVAAGVIYALARLLLLLSARRRRVAVAVAGAVVLAVLLSVSQAHAAVYIDCKEVPGWYWFLCWCC